MLRPLVLANVADAAPHQSPESLLFPARSTRCLPRCHRKRCAPNREECLLEQAKTQNCDALTVQLIPTPSVPLPQDYAHSGRAALQTLVPRLTRSYHPGPLLVRSLLQWSLGRWRSLRDATGIAPQSTDKRRRARRGIPPETGRLPSARAERHASRIVGLIRNRLKSKAVPPKRGRHLSLAQTRSASAPMSRLVGQPASLQ